jgi:hypothetical protein
MTADDFIEFRQKLSEVNTKLTLLLEKSQEEQPMTGKYQNLMGAFCLSGFCYWFIVFHKKNCYKAFALIAIQCSS